MRHTIVIDRPKRSSLRAHPLVARPIALRTLKKQDIALPTRRPAVESHRGQPSLTFQVDPYQDYGRYLTNAGGILIIYKDHDVRFRHTAWRLLAWTLFTGLEAIYLAPYRPISEHWISIACLLVGAILNFIVVRKPVELYRRVEVRPDCMIVEGQDVFWRRNMEGGFPAFRPDADGNQVLCGIYGTRFVEYLTARRFEDNDRMAEVLSAHLQDAMQQQWSRPP